MRKYGPEKLRIWTLFAKWLPHWFETHEKMKIFTKIFLLSLFIMWKWTDLQQFRGNILLVTTSEYWRPRYLIKSALSLKGQCRYYYVETNQLMMNENQLTDFKMKVWFFTLNHLLVKLQSIQKQTMQLTFTLFINLEFLLFFVEIWVCIR